MKTLHKNFFLILFSLAFFASCENEDPKVYILTLNVNPVNAGTVAGAGDYEADKNVSLIATAGNDYNFINWTMGDAELSTDANFEYTTTAEDVTITANFEQKTYTLTVEVDLANSGLVTGGGTYHAGDVANLTATANIGYTFVSWKKGSNVLSTNANYAYTVTAANETITATFTEKDYTITLGAQLNTSVGAFYSIAQELIYNQTDASNNQDKIDLLCFYEVASGNYITLSSPGANITGIFGGTSTDPMNWTTKRLTLFTAPAISISTTQFDGLHQNDPVIQTYYNSTVTSGNKKAKNLVVDNIYAFKTQDNVYGLFKITAVVQGDDGSVTFKMKLRK